MRTLLLISTLLAAIGLNAQVSAVYKIDRLERRISNPDTLYVVNFWATWCKPCIEEMPAFDSLASEVKGPVKILLVSLDFREELRRKVNPFLIKRKVKNECVLLDETDGKFIDRIHPKWSGAIPATLIRKGTSLKLIEKKANLRELRQAVAAGLK
jgi:thiol-disulfide isomerase/thioredoxin